MTRISEILNNFFLNLNNKTESTTPSAAPKMFDFDMGEPGDVLELSNSQVIAETPVAAPPSVVNSSKKLKIPSYTKIHYQSAYDTTVLKDSQSHLYGLIRYFESDSSNHNKPKTIQKKHNGQVYTFKSYGVVDPWSLGANPPVTEQEAFNLMVKYFNEVAYNDVVNEFTPPSDFSHTTNYSVQKGDTIDKIASKFGISRKDVEKANPNLGKVLSIDQKIKIPAKGQPSKEAYYNSLKPSVREALLDYNYRNGGPAWRAKAGSFKKALDKGLKENNWNDFLALLTSDDEKSSEGLSKRGFARVLLATRDLKPQTEELKNQVAKMYEEALARAKKYPQDIKDMYDIYKNGRITDKNSTLYKGNKNAATSSQTTQISASTPKTNQPAANTPKANQAAASQSVKPATNNNAKQQTHTVRRGETLSTIAPKYGTTVAKLKAANNLKGDSIREGQVLNLPKK